MNCQVCAIGIIIRSITNFLTMLEGLVGWVLSSMFTKQTHVVAVSFGGGRPLGMGDPATQARLEEHEGWMSEIA